MNKQKFPFESKHENCYKIKPTQVLDLGLVSVSRTFYSRTYLTKGVKIKGPVRLIKTIIFTIFIALNIALEVISSQEEHLFLINVILRNKLIL